MLEAQPVRFAVIGCGSASIPVCEAMVGSPVAELATVYDVNEELAEDLRQRFQACHPYVASCRMHASLVHAISGGCTCSVS